MDTGKAARWRSTMRGARGAAACAAVLSLAVSPALASVDLELRPVQDTWSVGDTVAIGLYAVSDLPGQSEFIFAIEAVFAWDVGAMQLIGLNQTGAADALASTFPTAGDSGLNEVIPPQDGDGFYLYFAPLGDQTEATTEGTLITTFEYDALVPAAAAQMQLLRSGGDPPTDTFVVGENATILTGTIGAATVTILPACPGDCAPQGGDGAVDTVDLLRLLGQWGGPGDCDTNVDGVISVEDLLDLLAAWGSCPVQP